MHFYKSQSSALRSISEMCPGEMRNLAPACLNGLGAAYLSGGISAVSAQCVEQEHKYMGYEYTYEHHTLLCSTCASQTYPAVND